MTTQMENSLVLLCVVLLSFLVWCLPLYSLYLLESNTSQNSNLVVTNETTHSMESNALNK